MEQNAGNLDKIHHLERLDSSDSQVPPTSPSEQQLKRGQQVQSAIWLQVQPEGVKGSESSQIDPARIKKMDGSSTTSSSISEITSDILPRPEKTADKLKKLQQATSDLRLHKGLDSSGSSSTGAFPVGGGPPVKPGIWLQVQPEGSDPSQINPTLIKKIDEPSNTSSIMPGLEDAAKLQELREARSNLGLSLYSPSNDAILAFDSTASTSPAVSTDSVSSPVEPAVEPAAKPVVAEEPVVAKPVVAEHAVAEHAVRVGSESLGDSERLDELSNTSSIPEVSSGIMPVMPGLEDAAKLQKLQQSASDFRLLLDSPSKDARMSIDAAHSELQRSMAEARPFITQGVDTREGGSKYSHCVRMHGLQEVLQIPGFDVPRSIGIPSPVVMGFLNKYKPEALGHWQELCELYTQAQNAELNARAPFLQREDVKRKIQEIEASIINAFKTAAENPEIYRELALPQPLEAMIIELQRSGDYLMVRSTGAEDELGASNAGGNKSVAYVSPTRKEVMQAMGIVVASYFSENSLKNRLDSGKNPFNEPLQLAVLTQPLIGEPVLQKATGGPETNPRRIPSSFVCFSCEPIWVGEEKFRVMRISATFGHGEGVVGEKDIPTDSWTVMRSETEPNRLYIISKISNKTTRLAPVESEDGSRPHLEKVKNPKEIAKMPSLSQEQVYKIFENAMIEEAFFNEGALDIEGVCKAGVEAGATTTHFVQARPVTQQAVQAEYFDPSALNKQEQEALGPSMQLESILPGRCNVVTVTNRDQLVA